MTINRNLYTIWFGGEMSKNRKESFEMIKKNCKVNLILITENNINDFILKEHPLHEGFKYLGLTMKACYFRVYLMRFHGGGYTDIKPIDWDWRPYFHFLNKHDRDFIGCGLRHEKDVVDQNNINHLKAWKSLSACGFFIFKKNTNFSKKYYNEMINLMNKNYDILKNNPGTYHSRACKGGVHLCPELHKDSKYPFEWNVLAGMTLQKIQYENPNSYYNKLPYPVVLDEKGNYNYL